ncbi:MAG: methyl-accepting chemotaxis protein [Clostridia bacterium]|nr:methyl-accepting chemotaxis protein [Clostridia bacterium]
MRKKNFVSISVKVASLIIVMLLLSMTIYGAFNYFTNKSNYLELSQEKALMVAKSAAINVDGDRFEKLANSNDNHEYFDELKKMLDNLKIATDVTYLYTIVDNGDENFKYIVEAGEGEDICEFGYLEPKESYDMPDSFFETGDPFVSDISFDEEWGYLLTASVPIYNSNNEMVGIVATDIDAESTYKMINESLPYMFIFIPLISIVFAIILVLYISKNVIDIIKHITDQSHLMADGNIDIFIPDKYLKRKDELGNLSTSFLNMSDQRKEQAQVLEEIAEGTLDSNIQILSEEDVVGNSIDQVSHTLNALINEMNHISEQHELGDLHATLDTEHFEGSYKKMAEGINNMIKGHAEVIEKSMACVSEFVQGNFDAELEEFTGKKATINKTIELLRNNLKDVNEEINTLISSAIQGRLNQRVDVSNFNGDWKDLMVELNKLLDEIIQPLQESSDVLGELAKGNLSARVQGDYKGDHGKMKDSLNITCETIQGYMNEIIQVLDQMAQKNLSSSIEREYIGDFSLLRQSINHIVDQFNLVLSEINSVAEEVESGANQVASSSQNLSQGASEQASSVEQISATTMEVSNQTKENAEYANKANHLSSKAKSDAQNGNGQMNQMLRAMEETKEASKNIGNIIKVIDEIAFQTNILALNAAVEAARAGEHGKGFAVVAEEVRNLAARSAEAAKETTNLIDDSINKVEEGYKIANETAAALQEIVDGITNVEQIVASIAQASNQQEVSINEINSGIQQISNVTQTNTATSEESASASQQMSAQAHTLKKLIQEFILKGQASKQDTSGNLLTNRENKALNKEILNIGLKDNSFGKY